MAPAAAAAPAGQLPEDPPHGTLIDRYCLACHNARLRTAGVVLEGLDVTNVAPGAATWERVLRKLRGREMPPAGRPRPNEAEYDALATELATALDRAARRAPNPGRGALHRLNRTEYANVIRDLLALEVDVARFLPPDDSSYGFDNIADVLRVSPLLLEQYLSAARVISRAAVGSPAVRAATDTYRTAPDHTQDYPLDGLPFGTRGGLAARHYFPLDAEYEVRGFLKRTAQTGIRGLGEAHDVEIAVDGVRAGLYPRRRSRLLRPDRRHPDRGRRYQGVHRGRGAARPSARLGRVPRGERRVPQAALGAGRGARPAVPGELSRGSGRRPAARGPADGERSLRAGGAGPDSQPRAHLHLSSRRRRRSRPRRARARRPSWRRWPAGRFAGRSPPRTSTSCCRSTTRGAPRAGSRPVSRRRCAASSSTRSSSSARSATRMASRRTRRTP